MAIMDLTAIEPQKVSADISSYTTMIYGPPKAGKTTFIHDLYGSDAIFARTEKGTKLIPGLFGQDIANWAMFQQFIQQLRKKEVKERFKVVVIDTIDNLYKFIEKYVRNKYGVDNIKDANGGYGAGYNEISDQLFDALNTIEKEGYAIVFISHSTVKTEKLPGTETEYEKYIPSVNKRGLEIATKMVDNILFAYFAENPETRQETRVLYTRETLNFQAGTRFKNFPAALPIDAERFKQEMRKSIEGFGAENIKSDKETYAVNEEEINFNSLMEEAKTIAIRANKLGKMPLVTEIVEKHLGVGKLLRDATVKQAETVQLIVDDLRLLDLDTTVEV